MKGRNSKLYPMIVAAVMLSLLAPQLALAAFAKLSGTMPAFGDVEDYRISPDGNYVVYRADQDTDGVVELYSVTLRGGTPVKLNGALVAGTSVSFIYEISPDSSRVIYLAQQDTPGVLELYSVPIAGPTGSGVKLNGTMTTGGYVLNIYISPDSSRVVYTADQQTDGVWELYSVPLAGPASSGVKLNQTLAPGGYVQGVLIISDSSRVIYMADQQVDEVWELYSVPLTGPAGAGVKLNEALVAGGNVINFTYSPDSSRVVYRADQQIDGVQELYSVPVAGPASAGIKLNGAMAVGGNVGDIRVSPDSSRVLYYADQDTDEVWELYSVPLTGPTGSETKLNGTMVPGGGVEWPAYHISRDSSRVVYLADQDTDDVFELYSVPLNGPASAGVKLNNPLAIGREVWFDFEISPDSSRVVYKADYESDFDFELYSVPLTGPADAGVKLNGTLAANGSVFNFMVSPDSSQVIYRADQQTYDVVELYSVPLAGPSSSGVKLNGPLVPDGEVAFTFAINAETNQVVYHADQDTDEVWELFVTWQHSVYLPIIRK